MRSCPRPATAGDTRPLLASCREGAVLSLVGRSLTGVSTVDLIATLQQIPEPLDAPQHDLQVRWVDTSGPSYEAAYDAIEIPEGWRLIAVRRP